MGTTVKVAGSMGILVILFGLVSCDAGVTPTLTTPTSSPVTKTPEDSNVTCCDTILLSSTDDYIYHAGIWSLYTSNPTFNRRKVYKMKNSCSGDYCLYWSSNVWRVSQCQYITYDYPNGIMYESANSKKCPHDSDLVWPRLKRNHTMKFSCMTGCNSPPPTSPSYRNSDWDGSTLTAGPGTVVTYTCSFPSACNHVTSQCDPQSLQWTSLSSVPDCFYCNTNTSGSVTTTPVPVTTTTEDYPATPTTYPNVTCCDNVLLTSTDASFLGTRDVYFAGVYSLYTFNPSFNGRKVYRLSDCVYYHQCLYWSSNAWRIGPCNYIDIHIRANSTATSNKCPHGDDVVWQYKDITLKVFCITACSSSPPTSPSDRVSDWDGSTLTAGTVVTYTCTSGSCIPVYAVCDPQSLQWTSLSSVPTCDSCDSTSTEESPATPTTPTYCGSDGLPAFESVKRRRRVESGRECQEYCARIQGAEYFKWKKTGRKVCSCIKPVVKPGDNFEGGPVFC